MNPEHQLVLGCFGLGCVIAYMGWVAVRDNLLRFKLGEIRDRLDASMLTKAETDDPGYLAVRSLIDYLIEDAANWYPSEIVIRRTAAKIHEFVDDFASRPEDWPTRPIELNPEVRESLLAVLLTLAGHVFLGHLRGWWLIARIMFSSGVEGSQKRILQGLVELSSVLRNTQPSDPRGARHSVPST